jgi:hypothetical protein
LRKSASAAAASSLINSSVEISQSRRVCALEQNRRLTVTEITDEYMLDMGAKAKTTPSCCSPRARSSRGPTETRSSGGHGRRNHSLRADGVLAIVCPIFDESPRCGIGIFDSSVEEVTAIMEGDPGVAAGVFTYELHPVFSFPGDKLPL